MYLVIGQEEHLIDEKIKMLLKKHAQNKQIKKFANSFEISSLLNALIQENLFATNQALIIKNWDLFYQKKIEKNLWELLTSTLKKTSSAVFLSSSEAISNKAFKDFLETNATVFKIDDLNYHQKINYLENYIKQKNIKIKKDALVFLVASLPNNLKIIINELEKLALSDQAITKLIIEKNVNFYAKETNFNFVNSLKTNDPKRIVQYYFEELEQGLDPLIILSKISSTLILAHQIKMVLDANHSFEEAIKILKVNRYRAQQVYSLVEILGLKKLESMILQLSEFDRKIKIGNIDKYLALDYFILKFIQ